MSGADKGAEPNADLQVLVSTLSASIVGPGDGPQFTNKTRLIKCCNQDGLVLKPDRPAVAIDAQWTKAGPGGEVSWSLSEHPANRTVYYLMAAAVENDYLLTPADLTLDNGEWIAYDWEAQSVAPFSSSSPIRLKSTAVPSTHVEWSLHVIVPVVAGWAVVGDTTKYVSASSRRLGAVSIVNGGLEIVMLGQPQEEITGCAYVLASKTLRCGKAKAATNGRAVISLSA